MDRFNCNTNEASRGNSCPRLVAFCIRNSKGDFVIAKGVKLQDTNNPVIEARAIREGLIYCINNNINNVILESDFVTLVQILRGNGRSHGAFFVEVN